MSEQPEMFEDVSNPLDSVEEILMANDWVFNRATEDELSVQVSGKMGHYKLNFLWQEEYSAMQFSCQYDLTIPGPSLDFVAKTISAINTGLWLGHFDMREPGNIPQFRHTSLFRGITNASGADHVEDLVDIALAECERYFPVFDLLSRTQPEDSQSLMLAMMDSAGES